MASGGILLRSDGKRILDATGKQILDDSCVRCCCQINSPPAVRYKIVVAGVTTNTCPIGNYLDPCLGTDAGCDFFFNNFGLFVCALPTGGLMCFLNIAGSVNGTFFLSGGGGGPSCVYQYVPAVSPLTVTYNGPFAPGSRSVCATPIGPVTVVLTYSITFTPDLTGRGNRSRVLIVGQVTLPAPYNEAPFSPIAIGMFQNLDSVPGCGYFCNASDVAANQNVLSWGISPPVVYAGTGGTVTIFEA